MFNIFKKDTKSDIKQPKKLNKAKEIARQYDQISKCYKVLSEIKSIGKGLDDGFSQGWRVWEHTIKESGIDVEAIYDFIGQLAIKRKEELESQLSKLDSEEIKEHQHLWVSADNEVVKGGLVCMNCGKVKAVSDV
jgi:hypothetical protein